jgi:hypothetical protein
MLLNPPSKADVHGVKAVPASRDEQDKRDASIDAA